MKQKHDIRRAMAPRSGTRIRTSIMELMQELSNLTHDDSLVVAAVRNIFGAYKVQLAGAPVPVRLVNAPVQSKAHAKRSGHRKHLRNG